MDCWIADLFEQTNGFSVAEEDLEEQNRRKKSLLNSLVSPWIWSRLQSLTTQSSLECGNWEHSFAWIDSFLHRGDFHRTVCKCLQKGSMTDLCIRNSIDYSCIHPIQDRFDR